MEKQRKLIEVITDVLTVKISESKEAGIYDVLFNQGYLVPFRFDGKKFMVERVEPTALEEFRKKKEEEEKKLNRKKTPTEEKQDMDEMNELPKIYEDIKVVYRKDPTSPIVDLVLYVNEILDA
jgi:hypothetical protein